MTVALKQENVITEIGPGAILHAFFSSICANIEGGKWGSVFPILMLELYNGKIEQASAKKALYEIERVISEFKMLPVSKLVWDIEKINAAPPVEYDNTCNKDSLYSYFRTTTGRNLPYEIKDNLEAQIQFGGLLEVISYRSITDTIR